MTWLKPVGLLLACVFASATAAAEPAPLTLDEALSLASERSPLLAAARSDAAAASGSVRGSGAPPNPVLEGGIGGRSSHPHPEFEVGLSQPLPLATLGPSRARAAAEADAGRAGIDEVRRRLTGRVQAAFLGLLHADGRVALAEEAVALAGRVLDSARTRVRTGDAPELEESVAGLAHARARAGLAAARADRERAVGRLALLLDLEPDGLAVRGELLERERYAPWLEAASASRAALELLAAGVRRPAARAARALRAAGGRRAEAEARLARAMALPELGLWGGWEQEEGEHIGRAGLSLELPLFDVAAGERAAAVARTRGAEQALAARTRAAATELETADRVYRLRLDTVDVLETDALPRALRQSDAAGLAWGVGGIGLPELLLIRSQALEARLEHLDAELAAALAGVELMQAAGWTP